MPFNNEEETKKEREKWKLTEEEYRDNFNSIFSELILTGDATPSLNPTFIMVGGQAGCGKSMLVGKELKKLKNGAIIIDQDILRTRHPKSKQIQDTYTEREEFLLLKRYLDRLINDIIARSSDEGFNLILESALRSVSKFVINTKEVKAKGYNTKLSVLAVSPDEANLSMFTRFCAFLESNGDCRRNTRLDNDSVNKIPINIGQMDSMGIFDDISISIRGDKTNNFEPIQKYTQRETPDMSPEVMYRTIVKDERIKPEEFKKRYVELRTVLEKYHQDTQLKRLDEFWQSFSSRTEVSR